jgi:SNF2 family DNA or RNA helicase
MSGYPRKNLEKIYDDIEFYKHQVEGVRMMAAMSSVILADDMGLGKSLQALTTAAIDFEKGYAAHILIVCPSYLKWNWMEEIEWATTFKAVVYHGTPKQRKEIRENFDGEILIVGYEQLANDLEFLNKMPWDILICDEAHMIKGHKSQRTKAVHALICQRVFLLTGSPILNRPNELWSLLHRCDPTRFKSYWTFVNRFCVMGGFKNKQIVGTKNKIELRNILSEFMIRRLKEDVLDLPEKQIIPVYVELEPTVQKKLYDEYNSTDVAAALAGATDPMSIENALTKMLHSKQIACTPAAIKDMGYEDKSYKLDKAVEMLDEFCMGEKPEPVVVFTQFRGVQEAMRIRLDAAHIPLWQLHGDVPNEKRQGIINAWSKSEQPGVLMVMLQMATGMNLTAASKEIFLDKLYAPKMNEQAEDRCYRIGADLTKPVQIFCLIARGTVEERIERILTKKRHIFKTLIEDVASWKEMLIKELREEGEAA